VLAVLSYRLIERPFLRRRTRRRDQDAANEKQRSASDPKAYIS
jgi:peptidoglycan/LPS O-acetylase OafA/YrhL